MFTLSWVCVVACAAVVCCSGVLQWCAAVVCCTVRVVACVVAHESTMYTHLQRLVCVPCVCVLCVTAACSLMCPSPPLACVSHDLLDAAGEG